MIVVFDTSTVLQAIFWQRSTGRRCFVGLARRRFRIAVTAEILQEYSQASQNLRVERFVHVNPAGMIAWLASKAIHVQPSLIPRRLSRDANDNIFVAAALAASASHVITQDRDLLDLEKPFGIAMVTPAEFLRGFEDSF